MVKPALPRRSMLPYVLLALLTLVTFAPCLRNGFLEWDDGETIARNPDLNPAVTGESFVHFWTRSAGDLYVPVTYTVWGLLAPVARVGRDASGVTLSPAVYHGFNILVHAGSVLLVYGLLVRVTGGRRWASVLGAAVFAVHPAQVETVAWASGTKDLLAGLFSLLALNLYVGCLSAERVDERTRKFGLATVCFVVALLSKPSVVGLPVAAGALGYFMLGVPWRRVVGLAVPWLLMAVPVVVVGKWAQPAHVVAYVPPWYLRPVVAADAIGFYLVHLVWPAHLGVDYGRSPARVLLGGAGTAFHVGETIVFLGLVGVLRRARAVVAGAVVFVALLFPVLGWMPFDFQQYSTVADHYLYLAMLGPALVIAAYLPDVYAAGLFLKRPAGVVAAVVVVALAARSLAQSRYWVDSYTLFSHALDVNPDSAAGRTNFAIDLTKQNRLREAAAQYEALLAIDPDSEKGHLGLGQILAREGQVEGAVAHLRRAVELQPRDPRTHYNLGLLMASMGRGDEAAAEYQKAIEADPNFFEARVNLGTLLLSRGDLSGAEEQYRAALRERPDLQLPRKGLEAIEQMRAGQGGGN